jgi:hypothetical protein
MEEEEMKREYLKLKAKATAKKGKAEYDPYEEEYIAVEGDVIIGRAKTKDELIRQLKARKLDPTEYEITKARIKLIL